MRSDGCTLPELLQVAGNHELTGMQTSADDPVIAGLRTKRDVDHVHSVIRANGIDLLNALHFLYRQLRYKESILANLRLGGDTAELVRPQYISRIRKCSRDANGS